MSDAADKPQGALVVGGGPVGIAAATVLAFRGWDVTVLDKRESPDAFEVEKAYVYLVDARGRQFTDAYGLTESMFETGVSIDKFTMTRVYADKQGIPPPAKSMMGQRKPGIKPSVWISRSQLLGIMDERARRAGVKIQYGTSVTGMELKDGAVEVTASGASPATYRPRLLLGCDGIYSAVRDFCAGL
eukprot:CAMPEP_0173421826 /NCGR_PEP_ID=MMETSP1357-20121228/2784_1 /TAXON_ID=77926 /ORGANISM="Hemiselmis rufescens, Strain PCC563" /LENGTH=186 /DNA_ID=CAMNT_0014384783 /DNA_START=166 /DNA_END=723 /DNA_ORIENTATION=-